MENLLFGIVGLASALVGVSRGFAATPNLKLHPGRYVVTITYEVQDQRQNELQTTRRCIARGDLSNPEKIFTDQTSAPLDSVKTCSIRNLRSSNERVSYNVDCPNRTVHVSGNVSSDGFFVVRAVTPKGNKGVPLRFAVRGRRTGNCSARAED